MSDDAVGRDPVNEGGLAPSGLEALCEDVLPALIARLRASRLGELEVRSGGWRVRLRRDPEAVARASTSARVAEDDGVADAAAGSVARSPGVGYFSPAAELTVGASVQAGEVLGLIDVLGIAQEVLAPSDGIVAAVLAEDGQAVEYGQALAEIDSLEIDLLELGSGADDASEESA